jgi:Gti1/Pac2 family transcription factor
VETLRPHSLPDAYWTQETLDRLLTVDDIPELRSLEVPPGMYLCARTNRMRETVSRTGRNLYAEGTGSIVSSPSSPPAFLPYPSQRRPEERHRSSSSPLSPSSPTITGQSPNGAPYMFAQGQGLSLAPLEVLEECRRFPRDPTDLLILKSFN